MNLDTKRALIRVGIIALLILVLIGAHIAEARTTGSEEPTHETQAATEPTVIPTDETEPVQETEAPTEATTAATQPQETTTTTIIQDAAGEWRNLGTYKLTAYCSCKKCCGKWAENRPKDENGNPIVYTSTGAIAKAGTTIAVDPSVIPYGSKVKINGHIYIAQDCGGAIKGNRIDVYFDDHQEALNFGVQMAEVLLQRDAS